MASSKRVLVTASSGLIGSEAVTYFDGRGWEVRGVDNNMRRDFFGPDGDTTWNLERLRGSTRRFVHHDLDIRDRQSVLSLTKTHRPDHIVHCAAQPSHDLAKDRPFDDFEVNAVGTLNLLESARHGCPDAPFVFMSTNKVFGDAPNDVPLVELETRWEYAQPEDYHGVSESCRLDRCVHSLFGASKLAADILVQQYGRYFGMPTVCLRGGCLTGPNHSGAELHGFLAYLSRDPRAAAVPDLRIQSRSETTSTLTTCVPSSTRAIESRGRVPFTILGGGRANSVSRLEAIAKLEERIGKKLSVEYVDGHRVGDHIRYISDLRKAQSDYPGWGIESHRGRAWGGRPGGANVPDGREPSRQRRATARIRDGRHPGDTLPGTNRLLGA